MPMVTHQPGLADLWFHGSGLPHRIFGVWYKPNKYFDLRLGTGTAKQTFVVDTTLYHNQPDNYGVKPGHTFINQLAFQVVAVSTKISPKTCTWTPLRTICALPAVTCLYHPSPWCHANRKGNRLVNVSMNGTFLYDKNTSSRVQGTEGWH